MAKVKTTDAGNVKLTMTRQQARDLCTILNLSMSLRTLSEDYLRTTQAEENTSGELWTALTDHAIEPR